jgi:hypothetical protein
MAFTKLRNRKEFGGSFTDVAYTTAFPGGVATSTAVSSWMGDRLRNTATAEPVDGVSVRHLIADRLRHAAGKRSSDVTARTALSQRTHVLGQTLEGMHTECLLALMTYMC